VSSHTFVLNGTQVTVEADDNVRLLWVLRDLLGVTGPKYGCGLEVCKACTSHINGKAFNPCSVPVSQIKPTDQITTIEGLAGTVGQDLHPMQQAWLAQDVAQCGYCQPGQIMTAVAKVKQAKAEGRQLTDDGRITKRRDPIEDRGIVRTTRSVSRLRSWPCCDRPCGKQTR